MDWVSAVCLLAVWPWACYLTCLMLDFLICKMDMVIFFIIWLWNLNKRHKDQLSSCASSIQLSFLSFHCVVLCLYFAVHWSPILNFLISFVFQNDFSCTRYDWTCLACHYLFSSLHFFSFKWDISFFPLQKFYRFQMEVHNT